MGERYWFDNLDAYLSSLTLKKEHIVDAHMDMPLILAYLRKMASASDAQSRRCLVLCECKPALQQIENAHRKGMPEGLRDWERGGEAIAYYRSQLEAVVFVWVCQHTWE